MRKQPLLASNFAACEPRESSSVRLCAHGTRTELLEWGGLGTRTATATGERGALSKGFLKLEMFSARAVSRFYYCIVCTTRMCNVHLVIVKPVIVNMKGHANR